MSLVITDAVLIRLIWQVAGVDFAVNTLHYRAPPLHVVNQLSTNAVGTAVDQAAIAAALPAQWPTNVTLSRVTQRDRRAQNQPEYVGNVGRVGTAVGDLLPPQTALCITTRTALAGRSYRGRVYLPGWAESTSDAVGQATAAAQTAAVAFVTDLMSMTISGNILNLAVARQSKTNATPPPPTIELEPGELNDVTAVLSRDLRWETQRRRATPGI